MTKFFVNLPLSFLYKHHEYLDLFISNRICPELGIDAQSIDLPDSEWHSRISGIFRARNIRMSVHMPFFELNPGSSDQIVRHDSLKRLLQGAGVGGYYSPRHVIIHTGYRPGMDYEDYLKWMDKSVYAWKKILEAMPDAPIYVENVYEQDPRLIEELLMRLEGRAGFCFDLGHWFSFGQGKRKNNLDRWLDCLAPYFKHLHLHDNGGLNDEHLGMGAGGVPFALFFTSLEQLNLSPTFTLEPHNREDFAQSLNFIVNNQDWFSLLGLKKNDFEHLKKITLPA
jgi:sugar phosphate isomerase/epimerase